MGQEEDGDPPSGTAAVQDQAFLSAQFLTVPNQRRPFNHRHLPHES